MDTASTTLTGPLAVFRESEIRLLTEIAETLAEMGDVAQDDRQHLLDVAQDLRDMFFLVVIIGEFNAGKSSFINALIEDDLLPTGITPTTEAIELIRYSETPVRKPNMREDGIREWGHPNTGAPGVALVDTPGTGSVFQKHEKVAKSFLHRSDLVIFLISAKRAFAETERIYLELAKHHGKKIILVVNQIDLLAPQERQEVRRFIERQVEDLLDISPLLFMVSAKEAQAARAQNGANSSAGGVDAVRAHLRGVLSEQSPAQQKLIAQLEMAERIVRRHLDTADSKAALVSLDTSKVREVQHELEQQAQGLSAQLRAARLEIDQVFDGMRSRGENFIDTHLSVRKIGRAANSDALRADFQDVVIGRALRDIEAASGDYVNALVDQSRQYWRGIIDRLNQLRDLMEQELSGLDSGVYAEQRQALQEAIQRAEIELKTYSSGEVLTDLQELFSSNMNGFTTSTVAAMVGVILTILGLAAPGAPTALATATLAVAVGGPLALIGGYAAYRYYRRVSADTKRDLNERIDRLEQTYHTALDTLTQKERSRLTQYGNQVLTPVFSRLDVLAMRYAQQQQALKHHVEQIKTLRKGIEESR